MDDDDFGELYGDQAVVGLPSGGAAGLQNSYSSFAIFDDDEIEEENAHVTAASVRANPPPPSLSPSPRRPTHQITGASVPVSGLGQPDQPADRDSDEDDDMLLLGYNSKSGFAGRKGQADDMQEMGIEGPEEDLAMEILKTEDAAKIGPGLLSAAKPNGDSAVCVPGIIPKEELTSSAGGNHLDGGLPGSTDVRNHTVMIPGLSTTVSAPFFDMGDNADVLQDDWEQQQLGKQHLQPGAGAAMNAADDWDTDSDDDLRIVLNTEYPYYGPGEKGTSAKYEDDEDEDDEDLIIFAGGEPNEEGDEQLLQATDAQGMQGDGLGEKQAGPDDNKLPIDKVLASVPPSSQGPRGYGYHNYSSHYKYVRAGASTMYNVSAGQNPGGRGGPFKLSSGRGDWRGSGRGAFGPHSTPQFSSWSAISNYEFTLPPSMTVFEIDLDSFDEKPWRQSSVDISDFFNFGFDEATWKDYCKQLAQLRLESTLQSKIRVYESGRNEQDYDPDLPPELAVAAGLQEAGDKMQQRLADTDAYATVTGRRGYMSMPLGRPIEVEGGLGDRRPSADSRKQRIRDCDIILLIDAVEIEDLEIERLQDDNLEPIDGDVDKDESEEEQPHDEDQEDEEEELLLEKPKASFKMNQEQHPWQKERMLLDTSKPLEEERRDLDLTQSLSTNHQDAASKPHRFDAEKESRPSEEENTKARNDIADVICDEECHGGLSAGQRTDDCTALTSRERLPRDVQADSSGCSSKRQRQVSPEGSHTASWDNSDTQKSARSGAYMKESRDSRESAMDGREDAFRHRKKHRSYLEISRGDQHRDVRHASEVYNKKQTPSRHDGESEFPYAEIPLETRKRPKQGLSNKVMPKELSRHSKDKDDARLKEREDGGERSRHVAREAVYHKEKIGSRSEATKRDDEDKDTLLKDKRGSRPELRKEKEVERRDRHESRRKDSEDRRDRAREDSQHRDSREFQHRDKDVETTDWHSSDRRKKEDEYRRKDRLEDSGIKKERQKSAVDRHDRDSDHHLRRKEEDSVKKEKHEDRHKSKTRDGTSREREDLQQRNTDHQESHGRGHKDDERVLYSGRNSRRHDEDRPERGWRGKEESRLSDNTKLAEIRNHSKDRRKDPDDYGKEKSRLHEGRAIRPSADHESLPASENFDRDSAKHARLSDDPRIFERGFHSDKHKFDSKRAKEFDKEANDLAIPLGDSPDTSKRKASGIDKNAPGNQKKNDSSTTSRNRESQSHKDRLEENTELKESKVSKLSSKAQHFDNEDRTSSGEDEQQRGRSKLERWMSHKDLESTISERLSTQNLTKKDEKRRSGSRERQHRNSPGLRDELEQEMKRLVPERKNEKGSFSTEQANGKSSKPKNKMDELDQNKDMDIRIDKNDSSADPLDRPQEDNTMQHINMAAKLEKRKERFKLLVEDKDNVRKIDQESTQLEKEDSRQERPPRKRRWASG